MLNGVHINFDQNIVLTSDVVENFANTLHVVTSQAAGMGLRRSAAIKKVGYALDHYYRAQGVKTYFAVPGSESDDEDGDGIPDRIVSYSYDSNGNLLTDTLDGNTDGNPDDIVTYTNQSAGWPAMLSCLPSNNLQCIPAI